MQCVTPMFYKYTVGDKKHGKVVPRNEVLHSLDFDPRYIRHCLKEKNSIDQKTKYIQIPCNHCWACQLKYSAEWATRIMLEAKKYENNYFITLTYDDENIPYAEEISWDQYQKDPDNPNENIHEHKTLKNDGTFHSTLMPKHVDTFLNSLRKHFRDKKHEGVKYYYCGEYGTTTARPHYHLILMNCPLNPLEFYSPVVDSNFKAHWKSKEIDNLWKKGFSDICELEWSCAAYVARYCTKKLNPNSDKLKYIENGMLPEFVRMSKGIGFDYFKENYKSIYANDELIMKTIRGNAGSIKPPRAYDRLLKEKQPKLYKMIKKSREKAKDRSDELIKSLTDATDKMMLEQSAQEVLTKMSMLPRVGEW